MLVSRKQIFKAQKMRLDVLMGLVSGILSYDQISRGRRPKYWKHVFQYFLNNLSFLIGYQYVSYARKLRRAMLYKTPVLNVIIGYVFWG